MKEHKAKVIEILKDCALEAYKYGSRGRDLDWQRLNKYADRILAIPLTPPQKPSEPVSVGEEDNLNEELIVLAENHGAFKDQIDNDDWYFTLEDFTLESYISDVVKLFKTKLSTPPKIDADILDLAEEKYEYNSPEWHAFLKGTKAKAPKIDEGAVKLAAYKIFMKALPKGRFTNINAEGYAEEIVEAITNLINGGNEP